MILFLSRNFLSNEDFTIILLKGFKFWPILCTYGHWAMMFFSLCHTQCDIGPQFLWSLIRKIHNIHSCWQAFSSGTDTTCFNSYKVSCHWDLNPTSHIMWSKHSTTGPPLWFTDKIKVKRNHVFCVYGVQILTMNLSKFLLILTKQLANMRLRNEPASWALFTCWLILTSMYMELLQILKQ